LISGVTQDSRQVTAGDLFLVLGPVSEVRGHLEDAIARGASSVAASEAIELPVPTARFVADPREAMAKLATVVYGEPTRELVTIGITGTNGKTTTTWIVDEVLTALGQHPALLGTIEARGPGRREASVLTTPESDTIARFARQVKDAGASHLVMEVSSHGLALARVEGVAFEVGAFTNLTQDHLDFHGTMDAYLAAKSRLFFDFAPPACVINVDDPIGAALARRITAERPDARLLRVSSKTSDAEVYATSVTPARAGMVIEAQTPAGALHIETPMVGAHNVDNLLLAVGCILASKPSALSSMAALGAALGAAIGAPGRLERVPTDRDVAVFVDYAHTPDALEKALEAVRPLTPGRLICVFGCGGDRDQQKRPLMGRVAARHADLVVVTSDNPRTEDPRAIVEQIETGVVEHTPVIHDLKATRGYVVRLDRREAIRLAITSAQAGDTVLIAGKGHENYQILGTQKVAFDDREEARIALQQGSA
jgi:UDP-N-acetylmuramoyl-L-alanyl-D-glutamate--2,6-diaminopimelate ligase